MVVLIHVLIALASIVVTGLALFAPSRLKLQISSALVALTLASGTYLVISTQANLVHACITGLVYFVVVASGVVGASRRLALESSSEKN